MILPHELEEVLDVDSNYLSKMNDDGASFDYIADYIEKTYINE